ncbi:hypothetical protein CAL14_01745 [Bordetella genomosp. 9]|uniref:translocation/assembly module TamB domain-containing protein n=1 Tax=Bordetella genomosp. 9 TaxID=1416803 RepID=UPI000A29521A|nr:translocation/assembly module TamB domain-containing protein [Bordetella genomosp. 9]ARP89176.1 hypothetical protein CAL14_01745 [Bordetella genomosp. 9]
MKSLVRLLRHLLVWWLPTLLLFLSAIAAGTAWLLGTQTGTQWLLRNAGPQFGVVAENVTGSVWRGVRIGHLRYDSDGITLQARDVAAQVVWAELLQRRLRVQELAAGQLDVGISSAAAPQSDEQAAAPSQPPSLPVELVVDRLALGRFSLLQDGRPLPVEPAGLLASLQVGAEGASARVDALRLSHPMGQADVTGQATLTRLAAPWPLAAKLHVTTRGAASDSPWCVGRFVQELAARKPGANAKPIDACQVNTDIELQGSLDGMEAMIAAQGGGAALFAQAELAPDEALPVRYATVAVEMPDGTSAVAALQIESDKAAATYRAQGNITADRLDLRRLSADAIPPALLSAHGAFKAEFTESFVLRKGSFDLTVDKGSSWNRQALEGTARATVLTGQPFAPGADTAHTGTARSPSAAPAQSGQPAQTSTAVQAADDWAAALAGLRVENLAIDLRLGRNRLRAAGGIGAGNGALTLDAAAPQLAAFWPGLEGAATLKADLAGAIARHRLSLRGTYTPAASRPGMLGRAPMRVSVEVEGGYGAGKGDDAAALQTGWRGTVSALSFSHAGFDVAVPRPVAVTWLPHAPAPLWQWQLGAARVELELPGGDRVVLDHGGSRGGPGRWETAGRIDNLVLTPALVRRVRRAIDPEAAADASARADRVNGRLPASQRRIALELSWDLRYAGALSGRARIARTSGDLVIPGDPPIPLGLRTLVANLSATPVSARGSRVDADLQVDTTAMGSLHGSATAMVEARPDGVIALAARQPLRASLNADIANLQWLELFTGDSTEVGGALKANVQAQGTPGGAWSVNGTLRGERLRFVRIDDGVRLVDGTLAARLQEDRLILDSLRFPATLRVLPRETRTRDWVTRDPEAKNGYVDASGVWRLADSAGQVRVVLRRFPVLQRADRFAMVSGSIDIDAALPRISIHGDVKADAGWASIEVLSEVPSLDGDVVVHRPGEEDAAPSTPLQTDMDLNVDLGSRFYLTGMGLDTTLAGSMRIRYAGNRLTGMGALHTRAGRIDAYGQRLQLRRGTVTFQGPLDNPLLDIEALRTGEQVEAGVRVSGTAQRPRIDLISYPDVSDEEKLSWLVLGRGPDASGNDTALLVSAGTALLGNGEPFYKQFGLDDVTIRNGTLGSSNSLLPDQTVAGRVNQDASETLGTQFIVASKNFADGVTLSVEQALAGSETVGRLSYRLSRRWSVDLKGGSVNGLELVYRTFLGD